MKKEIAKRAFDLFFSLAILLLFLPIVIISFVAIFFELISRGRISPFIISEQRISRDKPFELYKLNMYKPKSLENYKKNSSQFQKYGTFSYLQKDIDSIHGFGKIMKKLYLDELGQLFNIIKGDMSIVGPRPLPPLYEENKEDVRKILKAGLVCFASNGSKNEGSVLSGKIDDREYLRIYESGNTIELIKTDLVVMLDGFRAMLKAKGY